MVYPQRYSRRRNHRFDRPEFTVIMNGLRQSSANWSLGGLAVNCDEKLVVGLQPDMPVSGTLGQSTEKPQYEFEARVIRVDSAHNTVALEFSKLSSGAVLMFIDEFRDMIGGAA